MRRLKRAMDRWFEEGRKDALLAGRPNPGVSEYEPKYLRWAYDAGFAQGRRDLDALRRQLDPPQPRDPARTSR